MRTTLRVRVIVAALIVCLRTTPAPAQMEYFAENFRAKEFHIFDPAHQQALESVIVRTPGVSPQPAIKAAVPVIEQLYERQRLQHGEVSWQAFVVAADLTWLAHRSLGPAETLKRAEQAQRIYSALAARPGLDQKTRRMIEDRIAEVDYIVADRTEPKKDWRRRVAILQAAISRHQKAFGDAPHQWPLYGLAALTMTRIGTAEGLDLEAAEQIVRPYIAFAERIKDPPQQIVSKAIWLSLLQRAQSKKPEALAVARQLWPLLREGQGLGRPVRGRYGNDYIGFVNRAYDEVGKLLIASGDLKIDARQLKFQDELEDEYLFQRDFAADAWLFVHALQLRQKNEPGFWAAMKKIGERGIKLPVKPCEHIKSPEVCALRFGEALSDVGNSELAWEFQRIAKAYVDKTPGLYPGDVAEVYRGLAAFERKAGFVGKANDLERQAKETMAKAPMPTSTAIPKPAEPRVVNGLIWNDLRQELLDLKVARGASAAVRAADAVAFGPPPDSRLNPNPVAASLKFLLNHIELIYEVADHLDVRTRIEAQLADKLRPLDDNDKLGIIGPALIDGAGLLPQALLRSLADTVTRTANQLKHIVKDPRLRLEQIYPPRSEFFRAQAFLFCHRLMVECDLNPVAFHPTLSALLTASDPAARQLYFKQLVKLKADDGMGLSQSNNVEEFLDGLWTGFDFARRVGDSWLARAFMDEYITQSQKLQGAAWADIAQQRIEALLPMYVWLAGDASKRGQRGEAVSSLTEAERHVATRLAREWRSGGAKAAETLAKLRPHLRGLAEERIALVQTAAPQDKSRGIDLAFRAIQYPQIAEIALEVVANAQRRRGASPEVEKVLAQREEIAGEIGRIDTLHKTKVAYQGPGELAAAKAKVSERLKALDARINILMPDAANATTIEPLSISAATALLRPGEVLLGSVVTEERVSFVLVTPQHAVTWQARIGRSEIERRIAAIRRGVEADQKGHITPFPLDVAHRLFVDLFEPIRAELLAAGHVMLAADGPLLGLPIHLLLTERPALSPRTRQEYRDAKFKWLALGPAISVVPSLRAIDALRRAPASKATLAFAGVGDPLLTGKEGQQRGATVARLVGIRGQIDPASLRQLDPLPETSTELAAVAASLGGRPQDLFTRENATERALKRVDWRNFRVISFATHGLMAGEISGLVEPALVLTPPARASADDDGLLTASEIAALKFDSDLVILSACNTAAASGSPQAEGLSGLARAFFSAGARAVIASHWSVPSASTATLMVRTSELRAAGTHPTWAHALRAAMNALIETEGPPEYAHPMHWAPFVAVGGGAN